MSGFFRVQVTLPMDTGVAEDAVVNTWHFDSDQTFAEDADDVVARLDAFYTAIGPQMLPAQVSDTASYKVFDMADPEPRIPQLQGTFVYATTGTNGTIPHEVAICASMAADPLSGASPGRRRGRVYLGPCHQAAFEYSGGFVRVIAGVRTAIVTAMEALATGPDPGDARLAVFSRRQYVLGGSNAAALDAAFTDVTRVWVDDAPDIQRRRGQRSQARTTLNVT